MRQTSQQYYAGVLTQAKQDAKEVIVAIDGGSAYEGEVIEVAKGGVSIREELAHTGWVVNLVHLADIKGVSVKFGSQVPQ